MSLRVYNTLTKQKELFEPVRPGEVGMYLCGPTVYKSPHIGHMVGPVIFDAIKRYLQYKGFKVTWVVNITDVDDKLIDAAKRLNTTVTGAGGEAHRRSTSRCLAALGVDTIDHFPKATDHIAEIISICQTLIANGHAYATGGNVWFDVTRDARLREAQPSPASRSRRRARATWKSAASATRPISHCGRPPSRASRSGVPPGARAGPGWHIECSAMSMKLLGPTFDIHGGGHGPDVPPPRERAGPVRERHRADVRQVLAAQRADQGPHQGRQRRVEERRHSRVVRQRRAGSRSRAGGDERPGGHPIPAARHPLSQPDRVLRPRDRGRQEGARRIRTPVRAD